jgi:uncharacterized protein (UPF0212 family)
MGEAFVQTAVLLPAATKQRARELFEAAYDEHAHRIAKLYANVGKQP